MACIFKKVIVVRDPKTGEKVETKSKKWWGRFRDENGVVRRKPLARDNRPRYYVLAFMQRVE